MCWVFAPHFSLSIGPLFLTPTPSCALCSSSIPFRSTPPQAPMTRAGPQPQHMYDHVVITVHSCSIPLPRALLVYMIVPWPPFRLNVRIVATQLVSSRSVVSRLASSLHLVLSPL
ncbi:hypothetical protein VTO73DRAFT_9154 [Trametes versicolor]